MWMASRGRGRRSLPRGIGQAPSAFDQQAFAEAVGIAVAAIAQACAIVSQGGSNDLQSLEAHHPPMVRGGVDSRVRTTMTTEGEVDDIRGILDMGVGTKRKEDPASSNPRKKQRLLFRKDIQDGTEVIRTKTRMGLLGKQGR